MSAVDVVVVSFNSSGHLRCCIEPLTRAPGIHVVVVDNASSDGSLESVADLDLRAIALADNRGFGAGCNVGWRAGSLPYVLFVNPDARIDGSSVEILVRELEADAALGAVGPRIEDGDGALDFTQRRFPAARTTFAQALFLHRLWPRAAWSDEVIRDPEVYRRPSSPDWLSGACLLVRRSALEALGGFDEGFFMYCEDMDLCRRLRDAGSEIRFVPEARVKHVGGASAPRASLLTVLAQSRIRYAAKHRGAWGTLGERLGITLSAATHTLAGRGGLRMRRGHLRAALAAVVPARAQAR